MQNILTETLGGTKKMAHRGVELKSTSSCAMVGAAESKHNTPA